MDWIMEIQNWIKEIYKLVPWWVMELHNSTGIEEVHNYLIALSSVFTEPHNWLKELHNWWSFMIQL